MEPEMWKALIHIGAAGLSSSCRIIRENLTFDQPGLFSIKITSQAVRDEVECCNLWLVHQYIHIMNEYKEETFFDENLDLQRHILAAANLKQPWFFHSLLQKYLEVAKQLSHATLDLPVIITAFRMNETELQKIFPAATYPEIRLQTPADVQRTLKFCVLILEHFISDLYIMDSPLIKDSVNTILEIFQRSSFAIKLPCLRFFYRFFKAQESLKDSSLRLFGNILSITSALFRAMAIHSRRRHCPQPTEEQLQTLDKTLMKLFEVITVQTIPEGVRSSTFLATVLEFQSSHRRLQHSFEEFPASFQAVVRIIFENCCDFKMSRDSDETTLMAYLEEGGDLWISGAYLKVAIEDENMLEESPIWKELLLKTSTKDPVICSEVLQVILEVTQRFPTILPFGADYEVLASSIFTRQTELLQSEENSTKYLELIRKLLSLKDARHLDDRTQQQLFDALVYGLENVLELKFRPTAGVFQEFYEGQKQFRSPETEILIISLVSSLPGDQHLGRQTQNKLRLLMESIMKKSCSSVALPTAFVESFIKALPVLLRNKHISFDDKVTQFLQLIMAKPEYEHPLAQILKQLICLSAGQLPSTCSICAANEKKTGRIRNTDSSVQCLPELFTKFLQSTEMKTQLTALDVVRRISKHYPAKFLHLSEVILKTFLIPKPELLLELAQQVPHLIPVFLKRAVLLDQTINLLLTLLKDSLTTKNRPFQVSVLRVIRQFGLCPEFELSTFLRFFKLCLIFLMREESCVISEAMLVCEEMCIKRQFMPRNMFNWYKQSILEMIVKLVAAIYLGKGIRISNAVAHVAKLFEFDGGEGFVYENHALLLAHLLPFVVNYSECGQILKDICEVLQKDIADTLADSFNVIYQCLFLNEPDEIHQKCGELIAETTGQSVYELLHLSQKTVLHFLIYYHRNPQCLTNTLKCLLAKDGQEGSLTEIVEYISNIFLGVLTLFETNLISDDNEKSIKRDVLLSLGEIIRFMGAKYITQFRFKIVSLLRTAVAVKENDLHGICAQVWDIFLRTIDVPHLGSLLSTIVVSMEPLLRDHSREVNAILRYLIISNGNLLSNHLKDLFFIESLAIDEEVKTFILQHNLLNARDGDSFERLFLNYATQINHDNMAVRIYGIKHLTALFHKHRSSVNRLIMGQPVVDEQMEATLNQLIVSCKHVEENLQVAAAICVGEIGAIEPSYLKQNYGPQKKFCTSILSTDFAITTLADLCHAYQFHKESKFVDCFSLAIQELLQHHSVDPKRGQQMDIWMAIPERMRPIMEPLLTSRYANICVKIPHHRHPVFPCGSCSDWAYSWASSIIEHMESADIKLLLNNFRPSLKRDDHIMATLMPYIVLHGLQYSSAERREKIREEFELIFKLVANEEEEEDEERSKSVDNLKPRKEIPLLNYIPADEGTEVCGEPDNLQDVKQKCAKLAFNLLDFIANWCSEYRQKHYRDLKASEYQVVQTFLDSFDKKTLAVANFNCGEYARALQFMEDVVTKNPSQLQQELSFLGRIYAELLDSDSLEGAMSLKTINLTLPEQIRLNNLTGKLHESATCYERMIQERAVDEYDMKDMVQCYLGLDQPETALLICEGLMEKLYLKHAKDIPNEIAAEPLWRLGRFEEVELAVKSYQLQESANWGVRCGQVLHCLRENNADRFQLQTRKAREVILKSLRLTEIGENSYTKGYEQMLKLHLIAEIEKTFEVFEDMQMQNYEIAPKQLDGYFGEMAARLEVFKNQKNVQTILCLRRILYTELNALLAQNCPFKTTLTRLQATIELEMGKSWMRSTKVARKSGAVQQASQYILNCERYGVRDLFLEKAKLLWDKGDQTVALQTLNRGMEHLLMATNCSEVNFQELPNEEKVVFAKAKFLLATYNAQSMNLQMDLNVKHFKESLQASRDSEICFVHYAQFLDKMYESTAVNRYAERFELLREIMSNYGNSMLYGFKFIYQSMPRMLSIWLDHTADKDKGWDAKSGAVLTKIADGLSEKLPAFMFFTAFSQLVSRICHPSQDVYNVLKTILVKLILCFPQQSLWQLLCVLKSSYASRERKCAMILDHRLLQTPATKKLIHDFNVLAIRLIDLSKVEIRKGVTSKTVSSLSRDLPRILSDHNFSSIIVPCERFMQPILPSPLDRHKSVDQYVPFPQNMAYIQGVDEEVLVLQSLQMPRRFSFKASDGLSYKLLLKPKDDLRRDFRLMEFNGVVKHYLNLDLETRERRLNIRTYGVLPLNEEYGIIEWLDNLQTFRSILNGLYRQNKSGMAQQELTPFYTEGLIPLHKAKERFLNVFMKRFPPIFDQWFKNNFTTSHNWYMARQAYIRTCGVMSIVGYVLGLGDRHLENILIDVTNGEIVHVDFNCLFNAGENFAVPERVPFRLTHNMVHAMGPLGVEGPFRKTCEVTMRVLRAQHQTLMSVIRPFIYDPLVTWKKSNVAADGSTERRDSDAMNNVQNIENRLKGYVKIEKKTSNIPLSAAGQVNFVIKEAMAIDNVARMYAGWSPFM